MVARHQLCQTLHAEFELRNRAARRDAVGSTTGCSLAWIHPHNAHRFGRHTIATKHADVMRHMQLMRHGDATIDAPHAARNTARGTARHDEKRVS